MHGAKIACPYASSSPDAITTACWKRLPRRGTDCTSSRSKCSKGEYAHEETLDRFTGRAAAGLRRRRGRGHHARCLDTAVASVLLACAAKVGSGRVHAGQLLLAFADADTQHQNNDHGRVLPIDV